MEMVLFTTVLSGGVGLLSFWVGVKIYFLWIAFVNAARSMVLHPPESRW
jgi:hypothetical protein